MHSRRDRHECSQVPQGGPQADRQRHRLHAIGDRTYIQPTLIDQVFLETFWQVVLNAQKCATRKKQTLAKSYLFPQLEIQPFPNNRNLKPYLRAKHLSLDFSLLPHQKGIVIPFITKGEGGDQRGLRTMFSKLTGRSQRHEND